MLQVLTNPATGGFGTVAEATLYQQPAQFAGTLGNNYNAYQQGMAGLGNAYANAYGAYGMGLGNLATARSNEASARYGANALAEAARQAATGNIGSAALGAYGGASNAALGAWAANQQAYNQAAASMHNANQQGLSNYGMSRNSALGSLGGAYSDLGKSQMAASALSNLNFSGNLGGGAGGANGFSATGPNGAVASGSYGGGAGGGGGFSFTGNRASSAGSLGAPQAYQGLGGLQGNLMAGDVLSGLNQNADAGRAQLDSQHYSSRGMPSQMLGQALKGLTSLGKDAYGNANAGMDQYYANTQMNEAPYQSFLNNLSSGYWLVGHQLGGVRRDMNSGFNTANQGVNDMWNRSLGRLPVFRSPLPQVQNATAADDGRLHRVLPSPRTTAART